MIEDAGRPAGQPDFSIIVPVYNTEAYVEKCLLSILRQTSGSLELIIIDDGSTDRSPDICRRIAEADERVRLVHQRNEGAGHARNVGLGLARGKYIGFVDSDDWIEDVYCAVALDMMKGGADFASFGLDFVGEDGTTLKTFNDYTVETLTGREIFLSALIDHNVLTSPGCKVYRRELLQDNSIRFPPIRALEDLFFSRAMARVSRTARFSRHVLYHALQRHDSMTRAFTVEKFACASELFDLERAAFAEELRDPYTMEVFRAHIVKFLSFLLFVAAFRIRDETEYRQCRALAAASGYDALLKDRRVMRHIPSLKRWTARLASHAALLRWMIAIARRLGLQHY